MNSTDKLHQARLNEWAALISEQQASGLTAKEWCARNNVTIHKYNYWKHLLKDAVIDQVLPDIAPLPIHVPSENTIPIAKPDATLSIYSKNCTNRTNCTTFPTARINIGDISIDVDPTFPPEILCSLIKAVRYA